jgi:hypothetical protein
VCISDCSQGAIVLTVLICRNGLTLPFSLAPLPLLCSTSFHRTIPRAWSVQECSPLQHCWQSHTRLRFSSTARGNFARERQRDYTMISMALLYCALCYLLRLLQIPSCVSPISERHKWTFLFYLSYICDFYPSVIDTLELQYIRDPDGGNSYDARVNTARRCSNEPKPEPEKVCHRLSADTAFLTSDYFAHSDRGHPSHRSPPIPVAQNPFKPH